MKPSFLTLFVCLTFTLIGRSASAALVLSFSQSGVSVTPFQVLQGGQISIPIYLVDTDGTSVIDSEGLLSGGVQLNFPATILAPQVNSVSINPGFDAGAPFNETTIDNPAGFANFIGAIDVLSNPILPTGSPASILLGQFTFQSNSVGTVAILTSTPDLDFEVFISGVGTPLDTKIFAAPATANLTTVAAVPEPYCGALVAIFVLVASRVVMRHRPENCKTGCSPT